MNTWTLLATIGTWEYWQRGDGDVFRRKVSSWNVTGANGEPQGARWECTRGHYDEFIGPLANEARALTRGQVAAQEERRRQRELREARKGLLPAKTKHDIPMKPRKEAS